MSPGTGRSGRAIEISGLGRRFGIRWVLRGVTLHVSPGEVVGLLGANGSGKTTLLRVAATLLRPSVGSVTVNGIDAVADASSVREQVAYLAHSAGLYDDLTARENLRFAADMLGISDPPLDDILARVRLTSVANERVRGFSAGMQRRLALARLILRRPRVLLLDEPYANLDAPGVALMNAVIAEIIAAGGTALIALHELAPAHPVLQRTVTLENGRMEAAHGVA